LYCIQDATIAATIAILEATSHGISSGWVGAFHETQVAERIGQLENLKNGVIKPVAIIPLGYAKNQEEEQKPAKRKRLDITQMVTEQ